MEGLNGLQQTFGNADSRTRSALNNVVRLYEALGRPDQAQPYRVELAKVGQ